MELLYKNINFEQKKWETISQITLEEDVNLSDTLADMVEVLLKEEHVQIEEVKSGRDQVVVKGCLHFQVLYATKEDLGMETLSGSLKFEEVLHVDGAVPGDMAYAKAMVEDFRVSMINSRKIMIQSVLMLHVNSCQQIEEHWAVDTDGEEALEKKVKPKEVLQLCQKKQDMIRIKEEIDIPNAHSGIQRILWSSIKLGEMETRPMEGKVSVKGELQCFFIYLPTGSIPQVKMLQKNISFHGMIDCSGSDTNRYVSVMPTLSSSTTEVRDDFDGEEKIIFVEASLDLMLRVYAVEQIPMLEDLYSTKKEVEVEQKEVRIPSISVIGEAKNKVKEEHKIKEGFPKAVQILHTTATVFPEKELWEAGTLNLVGTLQFQILYQTNEEELPFAVTEGSIPYQMTMESLGTGIHPAMVYVDTRLEKIEANLKDSEELEVRGMVSATVLAVEEEKTNQVNQIKIQPIDTKKYASLPGMAMCYANSKMGLWDLGKKYHMSLSEIKKLNGLGERELEEGEAIFVVKGGSSSS